MAQASFSTFSLTFSMHSTLRAAQQKALRVQFVPDKLVELGFDDILLTPIKKPLC